MSKDLYIAEHERLTALAEDEGMGWQDAYEATADAAWDAMRDRAAERVARCEAGFATHNAQTAAAMRGYSGRGKNSSFSTFGELVGWIGYWAASGAWSFGAVNSVDDMAEARKWCPCLNGAASNVTDVEMYAALVEWRAHRGEVHRFRVRAA